MYAAWLPLVQGNVPTIRGNFRECLKCALLRCFFFSFFIFFIIWFYSSCLSDRPSTSHTPKLTSFLFFFFVLQIHYWRHALALIRCKFKIQTLDRHTSSTNSSVHQWYPTSIVFKQLQRYLCNILFQFLLMVFVCCIENAQMNDTNWNRYTLQWSLTMWAKERGVEKDRERGIEKEGEQKRTNQSHRCKIFFFFFLLGRVTVMLQL